MDSTPVTNDPALLEDTVVADGLFSIEQARPFLGGVSRSFLYGLLRDRSLPSVWLGKLRMIPKRSLIEFASKLVARCDVFDARTLWVPGRYVRGEVGEGRG
jgi:hypothetical protein